MKKLLYSIFSVLIIVVFNSLVFSEVYFNNHTSTSYLYMDFIKNYYSNIWGYAVVCVVIVYVLSLLLKNKSKYLYLLMLYILIIFWINSNFFQFNSLLDGKEKIDTLSLKNILNIIITIVILIGLFLFGNKNNDVKINKFAGMIVFICYASQLISIYNVYNTSKYFEKKDIIKTEKYQLSQKAEDLMQFSKEKNIIYILLDSFDSEYMNEIIKEKEYREMYKDFTYYSNYASAYPNTMATGVATFTNYVYKNQKPFQDFKREAFNDSKSFFSVLKNEGWDKILYGLTTYYDDNITSYKNLTNKTLDKFYEDYINIFDVVVYKITPYFLKNIIRKSQYEENDIWDFKFLDIIRKGEVRYNNKTFCLYHLLGAHAPFMVNENMQNVGISKAIYQAKASLKLVNEFLLKLKKAGVYDNSIIVIAADHGNGRPNALLLVKNIDQKRENIYIDNKPVSQLNMNDSFIGSLYSDKFIIKENKKRVFYKYISSNANTLGYLPVLEENVLPDNLTSVNEWLKVRKYYPNFSDLYKLKSGWYSSEATHVWGRKEAIVELSLPKDFNYDKDLNIIVNGSVYLDKAGTMQEVKFYLGDILLNKYNVSPEKNISNFKVKIPKNYLKQNMELKLETSYEISPIKEVGTGDSRVLAFALKGIEVLFDNKTN